MAPATIISGVPVSQYSSAVWDKSYLLRSSKQLDWIQLIIDTLNIISIVTSRQEPGVKTTAGDDSLKPNNNEEHIIWMC